MKVLFMSSLDIDFAISFNPREQLTLQEDWTSADFQQLSGRLPRTPPRRWRPLWRRWRSSSCSTRSSSTISTRSSKPSPTQQATGPHGDSLLWVRLLQNWDKWLQLWTPRQYFGCYLEMYAFYGIWAFTKIEKLFLRWFIHPEKLCDSSNAVLVSIK